MTNECALTGTTRRVWGRPSRWRQQHSSNAILILKIDLYSLARPIQGFMTASSPASAARTTAREAARSGAHVCTCARTSIQRDTYTGMRVNTHTHRDTLVKFTVFHHVPAQIFWARWQYERANSTFACVCVLLLFRHHSVTGAYLTHNAWCVPGESQITPAPQCDRFEEEAKDH